MQTEIDANIDNFRRVIDANIDNFRRVRYGVFGTKRGEAYRLLRGLIETALTEAKAPAE